MKTVQACTFTSIWDDGAVVVTTAAKIDVGTGRVFDIGKAKKLGEDGNGVENLDREYIRMEGIDAEFSIKPYDHVSCFVCNVAEVRAALMTGEIAHL